MYNHVCFCHGVRCKPQSRCDVGPAPPDLEAVCQRRQNPPLSELRWPTPDVDAYLRGASRANIVCYCRQFRPASRRPRQESLRCGNSTLTPIVTDVAGGLNWQRKGCLHTGTTASRDKLDVVVANRDRLARFGFELIEWLVVQNGGAVLVLNQSDASPESELIEDLLAILHTFSCRMHGLRRYRSAIAQDPGLPEPTAEGHDSHLAGRQPLDLQPDG